MGSHHRLGMPAEEGRPGRDHRTGRIGDHSRRRAISLRPGGKTPIPGGLQTDAQATAGEGSGSPGGAQGTLIPHFSELSRSFSFNGVALASDILFSPLERNPIPFKWNSLNQLFHVEQVLLFIKITE